MRTCIFCKVKKNKSKIIFENKYFFVIRDSFPVTKLHTLIISKIHKSSFFDLDKKSYKYCFSLLQKSKENLKILDKKILGFNVGFNDGEYAGQTINHFHMHLIPRRKGDQKNPKGGVRGVIPSKQKY